MSEVFARSNLQTILQTICNKYRSESSDNSSDIFVLSLFRQNTRDNTSDILQTFFRGFPGVLKLTSQRFLANHGLIYELHGRARAKVMTLAGLWLPACSWNLVLRFWSKSTQYSHCITPTLIICSALFSF